MVKDLVSSDSLPSREGFELRRELYYDVDSASPDGDYDDATREAFARGDWGYVGMVVVASRGGVDLGHDGVWGCENGDMPGIGYVDATAETGSSWSIYGEDLIAGAISNARTTVKMIGLGT